VKMNVLLWVVGQFSLVDTDKTFQRCLELPSSGQMEAVSTSKTSVKLYRTAQLHSPDDRHLHALMILNWVVMTYFRNTSKYQIKLKSVQLFYSCLLQADNGDRHGETNRRTSKQYYKRD
jgi:hypothetical protein